MTSVNVKKREDPQVSPARRLEWPQFPPVRCSSRGYHVPTAEVLLEYAQAEVFRDQIKQLEEILAKSGVVP